MRRHKPTQAEKDLKNSLHQYNRNEATLRDVYARAEAVLDERGQTATPAARARVVNEFEAR